MSLSSHTTPLSIPIVQLAHAQDLALPEFATALSAGMDMVAAVPESAPVTIAPGAHAMLPTGLSIALPEGFEAQVRPRSGLAAKHAVTVLNSPGTIDADYRGEICVLLINHGKEPFVITRGMRIAQMIIAPFTRVSWLPAAALASTERGEGGFGSTGTGPVGANSLAKAS